MTKLSPEIRGPRPSMSEAIRAKCFECNCDFLDGRRDCLHTKCALYSRMPYRKSIPDFMWIFGAWSSKYHNMMAKMDIKTQKAFIRKYVHGTRRWKMPMSDMIRAKCFDCMANYNTGSQEKGRVECSIRNCSLYWWTPYREQRPLYDWMFDLSHTKKHRTECAVLNISREDYIERVLG